MRGSHEGLVKVWTHPDRLIIAKVVELWRYGEGRGRAHEWRVHSLRRVGTHHGHPYITPGIKYHFRISVVMQVHGVIALEIWSQISPLSLLFGLSEISRRLGLRLTVLQPCQVSHYRLVEGRRRVYIHTLALQTVRVV